jgi:hypothetical protein
MNGLDLDPQFRLATHMSAVVPWDTGYGPKLQDTIGSLQFHMAREPCTMYQEVILPLQAEEMDPPN